MLLAGAMGAAGAGALAQLAAEVKRSGGGPMRRLAKALGLLAIGLLVCSVLIHLWWDHTPGSENALSILGFVGAHRSSVVVPVVAGLVLWRSSVADRRVETRS